MKIKLNNLTWEIKEVPTRDQNLMVGDNRCYGTAVYPEQTIYLDESLHMDKKEETLRHEIAHAIIYSCCLENKETYNEENVCDFMAQYGELCINLAREYMESKK